MRFAAIFALAALCQTANAQEEPQFNKWICVPTQDALFDLVFNSNTARVNNISIGEISGPLPGRVWFALSFSATNRSKETIAVSLEILLKKSDLPALVISASPSLGIISSGRTELVQENVLASVDYASEVANEVCVRVTN